MIGWVGWAVCFTGMWMVGNKDKRGFAVSFVAEAMLCAHGILIADWSLVVATVAWAGLHVRNLRKWSMT